MNTDIRLSVEFWDNHKTLKLERRLGLSGVKALMVLWAWAAKNRANGDLSGMDDEDIELVSRWSKSKAGKLVPILVELRWLDKTEMGYVLHGWQKNNPWAADSDSRKDTARLAAMANKYPELYAQYAAAGYKGITKEEYDRVTRSYIQSKTAGAFEGKETEEKGIDNSSNDEEVFINDSSNDASDFINSSSNDEAPLIDSSSSDEAFFIDSSSNAHQFHRNDDFVSSPSPSPLPLPSPKEKKESKQVAGEGGMGGEAKNAPASESPTQNPQPAPEAEMPPQNPQPDAEPESGQLGLPLDGEKDTAYNPEPKAKTELEAQSKHAPKPKNAPKHKTKKDLPPMTDMPEGPYDNNAFGVITEIYYICEDYVPDPGAEIKLIQELAQEYPGVNLFQEFRKARHYLESHPEKRYKDVRRFLRNWVNNEVTKYGKDKYYVEETVFVPIDEPVGGKNYDAGKNQNDFGNSAGCGFAP